MALPGARRTACVLGIILIVGAVTGVSTQAQPSAREARTAPKIVSHESGIHFTANTVLIPKATVSKNLLGVSANGIFKFKHPAGALASLKPGKVMFLQGSDAVLVTSISHSHGQLLVHTKAATLPQLIASGKITVAGAPNFRNAFVAPVVTSSGFKAASDLQPPGYPYVGAPPARAAGATFSVQGSSGAFGYSLSFTPSGSRLDVAGVVCFQWGSICSNGPSNGLSLEVNISGYIDIGSDTAAISVNGGRVTNSSFGLHDLHSHLKFSYTGARGDGPDAGGDPPVFHLPVGIDYTIPGEIPIYLKLQTGLSVKLGMSSKNTVIRGGVEYDSSGSESITDAGSKESTFGSGENPKGQILTGEPTVAVGPGGVVVAVQFPKIGVGLGTRALNGIGYIDMVTSMGQTAAGFVGGGGCSYEFAWSIGGGFEAQLGPFGLASQRKILIPTDGQQFTHPVKEPTC